ncbi:mitochondrial carrier domain-containing protein [Peziza echinospora]|nr:mitochondrial carrier domain-containing protein [Peziza echinospora]
MSQGIELVEVKGTDIVKIIQNDGPTAADSVKDIVFGSVAGMLGKVIEFPFDTVKVRLQTQPDDRPLRYKGPIDCFRQSIQQEGVRGLYRGISPPLVGAAAENSALFFGYSIAQTLARKHFLSHEYSEDVNKKLPLSTLIACGALSGSFASFVLTPIELIKCKMQVQGRPNIATPPTSPIVVKGFSGQSALHTLSVPHHPGPVALIKDILRVYGIKGLWHGQTGTFVRETGGSAAWFGAYEFVSTKLRQLGNKEKTSSTDQMIAGALAGVSYNFFLFPADSIKSKMQTEAIGVRGEPVKGFLAVGQSMYRAGGVAALYRGCGITCIRSAPSSAIIFLCFETLKEYFHDLGR